MSNELLSPASRANWIESCDFHPLDDNAVLALVREKVRMARAQSQEGVVLLDLDSTLYEVAPRTLQILREGVEQLRQQLPADIYHRLGDLAEAGIGYSLKDTLSAAGIAFEADEAAHAVELLRAFWRDRFFSNAYLTYDRPYPGTAEFVKALHDEGAYIVYLTGRDRPGMYDGTVANLRRDGFVFDDPRAHLWMKAHRDLDDLQYKVESAHAVQSLGILIASLENEPRNLAGLFEAFPDALHVFVETVCSDHPAPICRGIYRVRRFTQ